jgi:hypothetical protein
VEEVEAGPVVVEAVEAEEAEEVEAGRVVVEAAAAGLRR